MGAYGSDVFIYRVTLVGRWGVFLVLMYLFTGRLWWTAGVCLWF